MIKDKMDYKKNAKMLLWTDIMRNKQIDLIEDPLIQMDLMKEEFYDLYKDILDTLIGDPLQYETCVEYYFMVNPLRNDSLKFIDHLKKTEFYAIGINNNTHCHIKYIHDGSYKKNI
jgi:hypothetical protein